MRVHSLLLAAAGCALVLPGTALAADAGTLTFSWNGNEFTYAPTSFASANAGDTVTLTRTDSQINEFPVLYNGSGAFTVTNPGAWTNSCTGSPSAGGRFSFSECCVTGSKSTVPTVVTPGTL